LLAGPAGGRRADRPSGDLQPLRRRRGDPSARSGRLAHGIGNESPARTYCGAGGTSQAGKRRGRVMVRVRGMWPLGLSLAVLVAALDQLTKWLILAVVMQPPRTIPVTPFFNLVLAWNRGISFSLFDNDSPAGPFLLAG